MCTALARSPCPLCDGGHWDHRRASSGGCSPRRRCWRPAQDEQVPGGRCVGCVPPCRQQVRGCLLPCPAMASGTPWDAGWALLLLPLLRACLSALPPGFKCPICSKSVASDEMEMHFIMCLSKPRLSYNGKGQRPGCVGTQRPAGLGWLWAGWRDACRRLCGQAAWLGLPRGQCSSRPVQLTVLAPLLSLGMARPHQFCLWDPL